MTDIHERLAERQGPGPLNQPGTQDRGEDRALETFLKFNPPKFIGGSDPELAENWLERMTNIFAALDYAVERRVTFAVFQFEGAALAWYAPELVATERRRIRQFVQGFNVEIQERLAAAQIPTLTDALEKAQRAESARLKVKDFHAKKRGTPSHPPGQADKGVETSSTPKRTQSRGVHNGREQPRETPSSGQAVTPQVNCGYCRKPNHTENECWKKSGKYLYCVSTEHQIANCSSIPKEGGSAQRPDESVSKQSSAEGSRPKAPARIYTFGYQQVSDPAKVIEGTILAFHCLSKVLSDPSATNSFAKP
nr:uncharacterized protein LOC113740908 [Coffea arabica]